MQPQDVDPVKLFVAILWAQPEPLNHACEILRSLYGDIDFSGADHPFDVTDYYEPEMGSGLKRRLVSFLQLVPPDCLSPAKHKCNEIEDRLRTE